MLPDKTEDQIFRKAKKLGLERKSELIEEYYDENEGAWVELINSKYNQCKKYLL